MKYFIILFWHLTVTTIVLAQNNCKYKTSVPDELYRGRYKPEGYNYGNPYTMFNKRREGWTLENDLSKIRIAIENGEPLELEKFRNRYAQLYYEIYKNAISPEPAACNYDQLGCAYPQWVKNNAIVYLIGIKCDTTGGNVTFEYISNSHDTERLAFGEKAANGLSNLNPNIQSCFGLGDCGILLGKAFNLISYLQAYDALKTAKYYREGDGDRNGGDCSGRNKLREYTRNFYIESEDVINSFYGWKKNHGIIAASALGMASIVLNDAGVETNWVRFAASVFAFPVGLIDGIHIPRPNYSPKNWQQRADGNGGYDWFDGEDGIEDCLFSGKHAWPATDVPQTNASGTAGYAEGPDYAGYMLMALAPYMRAYANFLPETSGKYLDDPRYTQILKWFLNIPKQDGILPTYDNSSGASNILGVLGMPDEWPGNGAVAGDLDIRGDFILAMGLAENSTPPSKHYEGDTYVNDAAGNAIIRTNTDKGKYYFQFLFERGVANGKPANFMEIGHEDDDFGSFLLSVDNEWLAIDAPYMSSPFQTYTNKLHNHNYACFSTTEPNFEDPVVQLKSNSNLTLSYKQTRDHIFPVIHTELIGDVNRNVKLYNTGGNLYYILNDHFIGGTANEIKMAIHGNGSATESSFLRTTNTNSTTPDPNGRVFRWNHPCKVRDSLGWGLLSGLSFLNVSTPSLSAVTTGTEHGLPTSITDTQGVLTDDGKTSWPYGLHTKLEITQPSSTTLVQTLLYPYRCNETALPLISRDEASSYVSSLLKWATKLDTAVHIPGAGTPNPVTVDDTISDFHLSRMTTGTAIIPNPFGISGSSAQLETDAQNVFMSRSQFNFQRTGACSPSFVSFKQAEMDNGTVLKYDDTTYIEAAMTSTVHYEYRGKFKYGGFVYSPSGTSVKFFLPDLQYHFQMQGKQGEKNLTTYHDYQSLGLDSFKYVTVVFPSGTTYFTIEVADPCVVDCYFPPTHVTIDSTFMFNTSKKESLGHDLDIVQGAGHLNITNASRMSICPDNVLVNKDSIVMQMGCTPEKRWIVKEDGTKTFLPPDTLKYLCNRDELLKDRAENTTRNMIIVNDKAGLVLDSGSVTHIGLNSTILIRPGGTLIIKAGARVIVGDSNCVQNRGELLADHGSYICIEEGAHIEFYNDIDSFNFYYKDTIDRHIVYIAMPDAGGSGGAIAGKNTLGGRGKFMSADDGGGLWSSGICVPFCELKYKNPPYGIENRPFGWCNVSQPRAFFTSPDTLCINKPFGIDATRSLNETGYFITVCKYDTGSQTCITRMDSIADNGDKCLSKLYLFTPTESGYYRVRLIVRNDCNQTDTFTKILYVPSLPVASFTLSAATICPGNGTLTANGATSTSKINRCKHRWTIEPLMEDSTKLEAMFGLQGNKDWLMDSMTFVDSAFNFPGYHFTGGLRYLVSLTVWGWCSDSTVWDTVDVPLKVKIDMEAATTAYSNPVGPAAVRLKGIVLNATSWNWSPTDYLDYPDSLNPIATPPDSIVYVLTGALGGCSTSDTVTIWHNNRAYAGVDRSVCFNQKTVLGTDYNAAALIGLLQYKGGDSFWDIYAPTRTDDNNDPRPVQKYLTQYLIETALSQSTPEFINVMWLEQSEIRNAIITHPNFAQFFLNFVNSNGSNGSLAYFDSYVINTDSALKAAIDNLPSYYGYETQTEDYFTAFNDWYNENTSNSGFTDIVWEKITEDTICSLTQWRKHYNILLDTIETATYRMTLIDNVNSKVEFDEVKVIVDTLTVPSFEIAYQIDSTLYFINMSGTNPFYSYEWNFGDGSSSVNTFHASHTFPAFDSAYVVCLSLTNNCGTYIYCDTIRVDSSGLDDQGMGKRSLADTKNSTSNTDDKHIPQIVKNEVLLDNIPNPFTESTNITYAIGKDYKSAELRITDILGRIVKVYMLSNPKGQLIFDASPYEGGLYYSSLIVDGVIVKSKTMVIER